MNKARDLYDWYTELCWLKKALLELNKTEHIYCGIETIRFNELTNPQIVGKDGFNTVYKATWSYRLDYGPDYDSDDLVKILESAEIKIKQLSKQLKNMKLSQQSKSIDIVEPEQSKDIRLSQASKRKQIDSAETERSKNMKLSQPSKPIDPVEIPGLILKNL
ncbi:17868_t:CDS:2 [Racocetra persica]|uniref:17868_t:CDS:1 n=1 Tax=Racocetra persica TaxID=160502 RepID=A0ACA9KLA0_9GLOM|nr:17868_t:CDS:2 [Racocetra persica]